MKGDFDDIKSSIEGAKTKMKDTKDFIKDKEIRRNNVIIYKVAEIKVTDNVDKQRENRVFCLRLFKEIFDESCCENY